MKNIILPKKHSIQWNEKQQILKSKVIISIADPKKLLMHYAYFIKAIFPLDNSWSCDSLEPPLQRQMHLAGTQTNHTVPWCVWVMWNLCWYTFL